MDTINGNPILVGNIRGYLEVVNKRYQTHDLGKPFDHKSDSDIAVLLREQEKFEKEPARYVPLNEKLMVKMYELSLKNPHGFRQHGILLIWENMVASESKNLPWPLEPRSATMFDQMMTKLLELLPIKTSFFMIKKAQYYQLSWSSHEQTLIVWVHFMMYKRTA